MRSRLVTLLLGALLAATAQAQITGPNPAASMWQDPAFVKAFTGSYGFLSGAEPKVSDKEIELLRETFDLIKVQPALAVEHLKKNLRPDASAAFDFVLGNLYFQDGKLPEARAAYETAIKKFPDFRRAYKNLGLVLVQAGEYAASIPVISKAMELGEVDGRAYGLLGYGYFKEQRYYPAEAAYRQAILMQPDVKDWKLGLASCLLETARYADAIALFETLIKDNPAQADYWLLQANAYIGAERAAEAAGNLEVVRRMGKADLATLSLLGDIYLNLQNTDLALEAYLAAVDASGSGDLKSALRAAGLLTRSGGHEQSARLIGQVRAKFGDQITRDDDLALLNLEARNARALGDETKAVAILEKLIERDSLNGEALIELANHHATAGDLPRALVYFEQASKIKASERPALVAQAQALVRAARYADALPLLRRALDLKSDGNLEDYTAKVERAARRS
ncbi:MAG: tetratricopeptide repeat protein [Verrucomicrobiota bacterium]